MWSKMPHLYLSHLLGVALLLSQLPRETPAQGNDEIIKVCGREYVRLRIRICGSSSWGEKSPKQVRELGQASEPLAEVVPSSLIDTKTLNAMLEYIPNLSQELKAALSERQPSLRETQLALESSNPNSEELKKAINSQNEDEDKSLSELNEHSRKKRQSYVPLSEKCCSVGCTRRELAVGC